MEDNPKSDVSDAVSVINLAGRKDCSISELVSFLKSAFRRDDFEKAEEMLRLREEKLKVFERNSKESESTLGKKCSVLEKELGGFRMRCAELTDGNKKTEEEFWALKVELEKKEREGRELELEKIAVEEELEKYKIMYSKVEERFANLEKDHSAVCEKIASLEVEMKKTEQEAREKSVELKVENRDLECEKGRSGNGIADCKRRGGILDAKVLQLEEDDSYTRQQESHQKMKVEFKEFLGDTCYEEKAKKGYWRMVETEHQNEVLHSSTDVGSASHSSVIKSAPQVPGVPLVISVKSDSLGTVDNAVTTTDEGRASRVREKLSFNKEGSSDKKETPVRAPAKSREDVVVIIDSDDEMDIVAPALNSKVGNSGFKETYCNLKRPTSRKSLRIDSISDLKTAAEADTSSCEENIKPSFTPKRKRASKVITSDNEEVDDDDDDKVPLSKLKMKKLSEVTDRDLGYPTATSGDENVEKSITPSRRHIVPSRQCEETKRTAKISLPSHSIGENLSLPLGINGASYLSPQKPSPESLPEDDEVEEVKSESEGERLGGFIVQGSDGSEGEGSSTDDSDEADIDLERTQVLESIRRKKKTSAWGYEADMLDSFSKDPELRMKAVCALYHQQTTDEKSMKGSLYANNRGFNKFDALRGSRLAEFLTDGDPHGPLKKSVEELEKHDPMGLGYCSRLASDYSKQLFEIYQSKEDPHFLPC